MATTTGLPEDLRQAAVTLANQQDGFAALGAVFAGLCQAHGCGPPLEPPWPWPEGDGASRVAALAARQEAEALGQVYELLLGRDTTSRRRQGSHYTPPDVADEVVDATLTPLLREAPQQALRVCDPAAGAGMFLLRAGRHLVQHGPVDAATACDGLYGVDLDPVAVDVARWSLWLWSQGRGRPHLAVGDALVGRVREGDPPADWPVTPFHWAEVHREVMAAGGFDAVVGNPPYLGGSFISGVHGAAYREHLVAQVARGQRGNADLAAYFVLRSIDLLRPGGRAGLVVTNTIAEGATSRVGLTQVLARGASLYRADRTRRWPGDASLHYSLIWLHRGPTATAVLDGRPVAAIDGRLAPVAGNDPPAVLPQNRGLAFNGTKIYGQGFLLTPDEAAQIVQADPRCADVVRPYVSGDDLYGRPDQQPSRQVICFGDWPLSRAEEYPACLALVRERVRPERARLMGRNAIGTVRAERWWQFGAAAAGLYEAARRYQRIIAKVLHSHTHAFCWVRADAIYSHGLCVFADDDPALLGVLQSGLHQAWALAQGSTLGHAPRYTLSHTFETFPLPPRTAAVRELAVALDDRRRELAAERQVGLTQLQARYDDPDEPSPAVAGWRALQQQLDQAVAAAYGWVDLQLRHAWVETATGPAWRLSADTRREVMARLTRANRRAAGWLPLDETDT